MDIQLWLLSINISIDWKEILQNRIIYLLLLKLKYNHVFWRPGKDSSLWSPSTHPKLSSHNFYATKKHGGFFQYILLQRNQFQVDILNVLIVQTLNYFTFTIWVRFLSSLFSFNSPILIINSVILKYFQDICTFQNKVREEEGLVCLLVGFFNETGKKYFSSMDKANWAQEETMKWIQGAVTSLWKPHEKTLSASGKPDYINRFTQMFKFRDTSKLVW